MQIMLLSTRARANEIAKYKEQMQMRFISTRSIAKKVVKHTNNAN